MEIIQRYSIKITSIAKYSALVIYRNINYQRFSDSNEFFFVRFFILFTNIDIFAIDYLSECKFLDGRSDYAIFLELESHYCNNIVEMMESPNAIDNSYQCTLFLLIM